MNDERITAIGEMVDEWNAKEKERAPDKYPGDDLPLNDNTEEIDEELFLRAAEEMGITPKELRNWLAETARRLDEEIDKDDEDENDEEEGNEDKRDRLLDDDDDEDEDGDSDCFLDDEEVNDDDEER
jgi:hypothetical protein